MRLRLSGRLLRRSLLRPEPVFALLILIGAVVYWAQGLRETRYQAPSVDVTGIAAEELDPAEVRLVRFDAQGLEVPSFVTLNLPASTPGRLSIILGALREESLITVWPEALPVPNVFVESVARRTVAILDLRPVGALAVSVAQEQRLLDSIEETVLANGVDEVRYLLHGEATGIFLEHLAVPAAL